MNRQYRIISRGITALVVIAGLLASAGTGRVSAAACAPPSTDYGTATISINVPASTTYRFWTRLMVPDATNKTYLLEVDGANCYNVGGGTIAASTWLWADYANGNGTNKVQQSLTQGTHTLKLIGNAPGVKVDRIIIVSDLNCVPSGNGDNCNVPSDTSPPSVVLTAPAEGANVSGNAGLSATATDNVGVSKVEFYDNSTLIGTVTTPPYNITWNTASAANGSHLLTAKAYDAAGNTNSDSNTVNIQNGDTTPPSVPANLQTAATSYSTVTVAWSASTDNKGVTGYTIFRDTVPIATVGAVTSFADSGLAPGTSYAYQVLAFDAAGNKSASTAKVLVTTPTVPDPTPPTPPQNPTSTPTSPTQVDLQWTPSTDNIGVTRYDVYRTDSSGEKTKVGSSATNSFGDPTATPGADYTYQVVACDAANNCSEQTTTKVKTPAAQTVTAIRGKIYDHKTNDAIPYARVNVKVGNAKFIFQADKYGRYAIFGFDKGRYNLSFGLTGYSSHTASVQLSADQLSQDAILQRKQ